MSRRMVTLSCGEASPGRSEASSRCQNISWNTNSSFVRTGSTVAVRLSGIVCDSMNLTTILLLSPSAGTMVAKMARNLLVDSTLSNSILSFSPRPSYVFSPANMFVLCMILTSSAPISRSRKFDSDFGIVAPMIHNSPVISTANDIY